MINKSLAWCTVIKVIIAIMINQFHCRTNKQTFLFLIFEKDITVKQHLLIYTKN